MRLAEAGEQETVAARHCQWFAGPAAYGDRHWVSPDQAALMLLRWRDGDTEGATEGLSNREIAGRLVVAQRTAEGHVENILSKLGFASRAQVAGWLAAQSTSHT